MNINIQEHPDSLLPFYVNGSLTAEQNHNVEQHLQTCERCRNEIQFLAKLREQVKHAVSVQAPGELGLRRLMRDVKRGKTRSSMSRWYKPAFAAAILVIVLQTAVFLHQQSTPQTYTPLGTSQVGIQITFTPTASEAQIRALMNQVHARIIDGPGALGIYRIELLEKNLTVQQRQALIERLRAQQIVQDVSQ